MFYFCNKLSGKVTPTRNKKKNGTSFLTVDGIENRKGAERIST
jgi:hypothetical protein